MAEATKKTAEEIQAELEVKLDVLRGELAVAIADKDALVIEVDTLQKGTNEALAKMTTAQTKADRDEKDAVRYTDEKFVAEKNYQDEIRAHEKTKAVLEGMVARLVQKDIPIPEDEVQP